MRDGRTAHEAAVNHPTVALALIAIAIVVAATRVSRRLFESPEKTARDAPPTAVAAAGAPLPAGGEETYVFEVMSATGRVEAQRGETWSAIRQGDKLTRSDVVRTSAASGAVLRLGGRHRDRVARGRRDPPGRVERAAPAPGAAGGAASGGAGNGTAPIAAAPGASSPPGGATVDLRRGKVLARVGNTGSLAINARDTRTTSEGPARFVVLADENGRVASRPSPARRASPPAASRSPCQPAPRPPARAAHPRRIPNTSPRRCSSTSPGRPSIATANTPNQGPRDTVVGRHRARARRAGDRRRGRRRKIFGHGPVGIGKTPVEVEAEDLVGHTKQANTTLTRRPPRHLR
jgi:hypothetical protein